MPFALRRGLVLVALLGASSCAADREHDDPDDAPKKKWLAARAGEEHRDLTVHLNGDSNTRFDDGWYPAEHDRDGGAAWRWMGRKAIVHKRVVGPPMDMRLSLFGWVPYEQMLDARTLQMQISVRGRVVDTFVPPHGTFRHDSVVPASLLGGDGDSRFVEVTITVANVIRPPGDWRDLGFATTGIFFAPVGAP